MITHGHRGFTVVELIAVMVVVGILSATIIPRLFSTQTFQLQATRDEFVAAASLAQQLAMARDGAGAQVTLVTSSNSIDIMIGSTHASIGSISYPKSLPDGYTLSPVVTLNYDRLGQTAATNFTIASSDGGSVVVTMEASGYAH